MKENKIYVLGGQRVRLSLHIHTRPSDIEKFFQVCDQVLGGMSFLRSSCRHEATDPCPHFPFAPPRVVGNMSLQRVAKSLVAAAALLASGCDRKDQATKPLDGQALAAFSCAQCHPCPSPSFLPREEWPYLVAWMGSYLGHPAEIELHPLLVDSRLVPADTAER